MDASNVDAAAIAVAAHDVRRLVRLSPERLLWSPGRPIWGIALVQGGERAVISIDGCLTVAMTIWPAHYRARGHYPLDAIVRILQNSMGLKRWSGAAMFSCSLPHAISGTCCVIVTQAEIPWLAPNLDLVPLVEMPVWTAPEEPPSTAHLLPIHPWMTLGGLRPSCATAAEFFSMVGEPPEMQILPDLQRGDRLVSYWRMHVLHERERLRLAVEQEPPWLSDVGELRRLAEAWIRGWRGPDPHGVVERIITPAATPTPAAPAAQVDGTTRPSSAPQARTSPAAAPTAAADTPMMPAEDNPLGADQNPFGNGDSAWT